MRRLYLTQGQHCCLLIGEMGEDKDYASFYYADEINLLADNLEQICANIYPGKIPHIQRAPDSTLPAIPPASLPAALY